MRGKRPRLTLTLHPDITSNQANRKEQKLPMSVVADEVLQVWGKSQIK